MRNPENSRPEGVISLARHLMMVLAVSTVIRFEMFARDLETIISTAIPLKLESTVLSRNNSSRVPSNCKCMKK